MSNQYNNDQLPFQNKIVGMEIPSDTSDVTECFKYIAEIFENLYGIIICLFGTERYVVKLNPNVPIKTMLIADKLSTVENLENEIDIIPFPKK